MWLGEVPGLARQICLLLGFLRPEPDLHMTSSVAAWGALSDPEEAPWGQEPAWGKEAASGMASGISGRGSPLSL